MVAVDGDARADFAPNPAAQARVQELIDATENGAIAFRAGTSGEVIHIQSGMVCLRGDQAMALTHLFVYPGVPVGDDVGCDYVTPEGKLTVFATRRESLTFNSYAAGIFQTIAGIYPTARRIDGPMVMTYEGINQPAAGAFAVEIDGKPYISSVWIAEVRGWFVEVRATYPSEPRHDPEFLAALSMMWAQKSVRDSASAESPSDSSAPQLRPRSADD
ncbi:MAG: hypothetical protein AB7I59_18600 [Geminicoccaceae bacterium]